MSECSCASLRLEWTASALLAETHKPRPNPGALADEICTHLNGAIIAALQEKALPSAVKEAFALLAGPPLYAPLRPALRSFLARCGDVEAFAEIVRLVTWEGDIGGAVELLRSGPGRELVAPGPDLGRRLRARGLDARNLLEQALQFGSLDLANSLMELGVDPTLCYCTPGTALWGACECDEAEACRCTPAKCVCNLIERFQTDLRACSPEALRALLLRGCRPSTEALVWPAAAHPAVSILGSFVLTGRREHLAALLEFDGIAPIVWELRAGCRGLAGLSSTGLREFALKAGAEWVLGLLDRASR